MEAVPATSGVRRTVRLAGALVAGQLLLVVVIGWVTIAAAHRPAHRAPAVDQLAAPPAVIPPPAVPPAPIPSPTTDKDPSSHTAKAVGTSKHAADSELAAAAPSSGTPPRTTTVPPTSTVAPAPPGSTFGPAGGAPAGATATPVLASSAAPASTRPASPSPTIRAGQPCTELLALARDVDGWLVRCLPTRYHQLVWKIV